MSSLQALSRACMTTIQAWAPWAQSNIVASGTGYSIARGICNVGVQSSCQPGQHEHCGAHMRHSAASGLMHHYQQRRYKHGHKRKGSFMERIKKTANGEFIAHHPHYRHKRYQKSRSQLNRLKGTFVLPKFLQRKLRKAGF